MSTKLGDQQYRRPDLLPDKLCTAIHGPDIVLVVPLRDVRATVATVLQHDDDDLAPRRDTDDVRG